MSSTVVSFSLETANQQHSLAFENVRYLGGGVYTCELNVESNGFMCKRTFGFDNDEYFLSKLNAVLKHSKGEATLTDIQEDSFIRFKSNAPNSILIGGYIVAQSDVTHSIEFAFHVDAHTITEFADYFRKMVRANV